MSEENLESDAGQAGNAAAAQDMNILMRQRMEKAEELKAAGIEPFGRGFPGTQMIAAVRAEATPAEGEEFGPTVTVAGRLMAKRGMRSTRILTGYESIVSVPNNTIAEEAIENISNRGVIRYLFTAGLVYGTTAEQMQLAMKLIHEVVDNFKGPDAPQRNPRVFFEEFAASSLNIRVIMWLKTTSFEKEEALRTEINLEILRKFSENNLEMAFNTTTNCLTGSVQLLPPPPVAAAKQ